MNIQSPIDNKTLIFLIIIMLLTGAIPIQSDAQEKFDCGDGSRYKIDVKQFKIDYSGKTFEGALEFLSKLKINLKAEDKTLQQASEATQQWNQFLISLAEGYNSCAITKKQYQEAISSLYPALQSDTQKMLNIGKALETGKKTDLSELRQLLDDYVKKLKKFAQFSGKEELIKSISNKVEKEHEKTRKLITEQGGSIDKKLDFVIHQLNKRADEKDKIIAELKQKLDETEKELQKKGASEALEQLKQGEYEEAEKLFQKEFQEKKAESASAAYHLGNIKFIQLDFKAAAKYYIEAVQLDPDNPIYLNEAGYSLYFLSYYAEAEPLYKRSLAIVEEVLDPDDPYIATLLNNLADLYRVQGKYAEAGPLYKQSLKIREKALGSDHADVGTSLNNLALLYQVQGKYAETEPLYKQSLKVREKVFGPDHPHVAASLNNLALLYQAQGKYGEAEPLYKQSLAMVGKGFPPDHPNVATSLNNLASLYQAQGRYAEAEPLLLARA